MQCLEVGCIDEVRCKGRCKKHYHRFMNKLNYKNNTASYTIRNKLWRLNNKEVQASLSKKHYEVNKTKLLSKQAARRANNKKLVSEYGRAHYRANKRRYIAKDAKRRAKKLQRTPKWADLKEIERFYSQCPAGMEVDHIIPLQGKNVSGLHVLNNLQYLTRAENRSKGNRFIVKQSQDGQRA